MSETSINIEMDLGIKRTNKLEYFKFYNIKNVYLQHTKNPDLPLMADEIRENNTLEHLQEVGYIDIDSVDANLNDFMAALEKVTGKEYKISSEVGKTVIREVEQWSTRLAIR